MKHSIILSILLTATQVVFAAGPTTDIRLDQVGYLPGMP